MEKNFDVKINISSKYTGEYPNNISFSVQRVISDTPMQDNVSMESIAEFVTSMNGVKEVSLIYFIYRRPKWLWKRLSKMLPKKWCGKYNTDSNRVTVNA